MSEFRGYVTVFVTRYGDGLTLEADELDIQEAKEFIDDSVMKLQSPESGKK